MNKKRIKRRVAEIVSALPGGKTLLRARGNFLARRRFARIGDAKEVFRHYYENNEWGNAESVSGPGSMLKFTQNIRTTIPQLVRDLGVRVFLDAPCGDYNWFRMIEWDTPITYIGGDIVEPMIERNRARYGSESTRFIALDIVNDTLPAADLWLCRDCLIHLSNRDVFQTFNNFLKSNIRFLLVSTCPDIDKNDDIPTGAGRPLNLRLPPFSLGEPLRSIDDTMAGDLVKHLALWEREAVRDALASNMAFQRTVELVG